jgi:HSP20 family protein
MVWFVERRRSTRFSDDRVEQNGEAAIVGAERRYASSSGRGVSTTPIEEPESLMSLDNPTIRVHVGSAPAEESLPTAAQESLPRTLETFTPPIDIHEDSEGLVLEADLPGANEQNLSIQLEDNILSLYAQIDSPAPQGARLLHEEYRLGDYRRSFILSDEVDRDRISAELKNGVLRLFLPKSERSRTRRIEIKS